MVVSVNYRLAPGKVQAERWDGKLPSTMVPGAATPMLSLK